MMNSSRREAPLTRRRFMAATLAAVGGGLASCVTGLRGPKLPEDPFRMGVASGDPGPTSLVLWTRLAPRPVEATGGMPPELHDVEWILSEDESFSKGVRRGRAVALPELGHSVHVEAGGLSPDRPYWYQFRVRGHASPVGRTRTLPGPGSLPRRLRFGVASCQNVEQGFYTAYEHMLRDDVDLVFHLGDYIYEGRPSPKALRPHVGTECTTLAGYRTRYGQYKSDPALMAMHAAAPWVATPDDHEFDNNCAGDVSEEKEVLPEDFLKRRAIAYQAYYENMPFRRASMPRKWDMQLYRRFSYGRLAELFVLDTRQYRTDQPCGDRNKPPCPEVMDPNATIMGKAQRDWVFGGLAGSEANWNVLAQQVMIARVDRKYGEGIAYSMDQWPGYEVERRGLLRHLHDQKIANTVTLAGDIHTNWANDLIADFDDLESRVVATEFVGTSISSGGDGNARPGHLPRLHADNPFVRFHNAERGYLRCEVTADEWRTDFRTVPFVRKRGAPVQTRASYVVERGRPGANKA